MDSETTIRITDYFRANIFEALCAYNGWKMLFGSRQSGIVSEKAAQRYVEIQNHHGNFFTLAEEAFLTNFVLKSLHSFDRKREAFSLRKIDRAKTESFIKNNQIVIDALYKLRHEIFAHRKLSVKLSDNKIPSIEKLEQFFKNLMDFYNSLTLTVDQSSTVFINADDVKYDIEALYMNISFAEAIRRNQPEAKWEKGKRASELL